LFTALAFRFTTDGQKEYTARLEIEYEGVRTLVKEEVTESSDLSFISNEFQLVHSNTV
tara:strand:- start:1167 stop:1340 length:174 start_codon:yes stop_codon:yes gene_type:complete